MGLNKIPLEMHIAPIDFFSAILEKSETAFLLESSEGPKKLARFSFLGFSPSKHIELKEGKFYVNGNGRETKNPLADLKAEIGNSPDLREGFIGGAVGYFSFDYFGQLEKMPKQKEQSQFPDFEFGIFEDAIVYDHKEGTLNYIYLNENRLPKIMEMVHNASFGQESMQMYNQRCNMTKEKFMEMVQKAKEYITNGEVFQVVISKKYEVKFSGSLIPFYKKLKATNPSPYMYHLKFRDRQVIGSSPENLIRVEGKEITSYATLAGTRERGKTDAEDKELEQDLLADEKERAEHIMLVDLTRNDIGKVAVPGSVKVPELMAVHKFSHVQHIASQVVGKLQDGKDAFDAFNAIFPAGTVSGAPKIRAIEIIEELEETSRGPYAGAVGYFSANGNADFAIAIRTLFASKNKAYIQSGAGIVYDSAPEKEFEESENKAKALLHALGEDRYEAAINK